MDPFQSEGQLTGTPTDQKCTQVMSKLSEMFDIIRVSAHIARIAAHIPRG